MHTVPGSALSRAALLLPHQGPIGVFIHQNTLSALEHLDFQDALDHAERVLGAQVRLREAEYRDMLGDGRIRQSDLRRAFEADEGKRPEEDSDPTNGLCDARLLRWEVLSRGYAQEPWRARAFRQGEGENEQALALATEDERRRIREGCRRSLEGATVAKVGRLLARTDDVGLATERVRESLGLASLDEVRLLLRDDAQTERLGFKLLRSAALEHLEVATKPGIDWTGSDAEVVHEKVDDLLLPFIGGYLDQGFASWRPNTKGGLWAAGTRHLLAVGATGVEAWRRELRSDLRARWRDHSAEEALDGMLLHLDPTRTRHEDLLTALLHARPGWAGAIAWQEHDNGAPHLVDYAALRLLITIHASRATKLDPVRLLLARFYRPVDQGTLADRLAHMLLYAGTPPDQVRGLSDEAWHWLLGLVLETGSRWRVKLLQEAREADSAETFLSALSARRRMGPIRPPAPRAQVIFCIDEREESMRRALEEVGKGALETFSTAGFFGLAIEFRGLEDGTSSARCPVVIEPSHRVDEQGTAPRSSLRPLYGRAGQAFERWSRTLVGGAVASLVTGIFALVAVGVRVATPTASTLWIRRTAQRIAPPVATTLQALKTAPDNPGFSPDEAAVHVARMLRAIGLTRGFAPLVVVMGHGSTNTNNPHASAYECGACGGHKGDANARTFAALANDPGVRSLLRESGIDIPDPCRFVGGCHDSASDEVRLALEGAPDSDAIRAFRSIADAARALHAQERSRRFLQAPGDPAQATAHVVARSHDLSQPRPEYGHATNAILVVGPRAMTRGLYLDRRAFLQSYEPGLDPDGHLLEQLLGAVVPVCAGINLEYYFSRVDNERFGCGTKIPHNVTGLHGVMNGSIGDLRTGLALQTVEIHEPVRLLAVIFAPPERVEAVVRRLPVVLQYVRNHWIHLCAMPDDQVWRWEGDTFVQQTTAPRELPTVATSADHFRGRSHSLDIVRVLDAESVA